MPAVIIHGDERYESNLRKHRHHEKPSERKKYRHAAARRKGRRERYWA